MPLVRSTECGKPLEIRPMSDNSHSDPRRFVFLLLGDFPLISLAAALEPLQRANSVAERTLYEWNLVSENAGPVVGSEGIELGVDDGLIGLSHRDIMVVCGGRRVRHHTTKRILNWLRRESLKGTTVAGLNTGPHAMARAGLLNGRRATIHREHRDSFAEEFPDVELTKAEFAVDGKRMTAAGGLACTELFLHLITQEHGELLAGQVAEELHRDALRPDFSEDGPAAGRRHGKPHPKLASVIRTMEENVEEPVSALVLARSEGMSLRQLERLFRRHLNSSPKRFYMEIRLQRARNLLTQTEMTVLDIAVACGFGSPSHFSKCYRLRYGTTPYRDRGLHSGSNSAGAIR